MRIMTRGREAAALPSLEIVCTLPAATARAAVTVSIETYSALATARSAATQRSRSAAEPHANW
jgi:hypothetical protein